MALKCIFLQSKRCHKFYGFTNFTFCFLTKLPEKSNSDAFLSLYQIHFLYFYLFFAKIPLCANVTIH